MLALVFRENEAVQVIRKRLLVILALMMGMIITGCSGTVVVPEAIPSPSPSGTVAVPEATPSPSPSGTVAVPEAVPSSRWLHDGPIYETHPYYHGGTFNGITKSIPEIAGLGVQTLYLMPIWEQPQGFPTEMERHCRNIYQVQDFFKIDPVYGTPQDLKRLVATAHEYGLKVLFDLIPNNTPEGSVIWNNGWTHKIGLSELQSMAERAGVRLEYKTAQGKDYVTYGCITRQSNLLCEVAGLIVDNEIKLMHFPRQGWGFAPDYTNPELIDYFTTLTEYYVKEYDIDGWRVDAPANNWNPKLISGDHSIPKLLESVRKAITNVKPDAVLLCETSHVSRESNPAPVLDKICEASYSHYFYLKIVEEKVIEEGSQKLIDVLNREQIWYDATRTRFLEIHDSPRITEVAPGLDKPLLVLMATVPGIPMIQAGQEVGATTRYGPDLWVAWDRGDNELEFYKKVFQIRNSSNALKFGSIESVWRSGDAIYAYLRSYQGENVVVAINFQKNTATSVLSLPFASNTVLYDALNDEMFKIDDPDNLEILVPGNSSRILVVESD